MKQFKHFLIILAVSTLAAPSSFAETKRGSLSDPYLEAKQEFAFDITKEIIKRDGENLENLFISPTSLNMALSMLLEGTRSQTREEMLWSLRYPQGVEVGAIHQSHANYLQQILSRDDHEGFTLSINNSIWGDLDFALNEDFVRTISLFYDATIGTRDFRNEPEAVSAEINDWACRSTEKRICKVIDVSTVRNLQLLIANAIYFKGTWVRSFDIKLTQNRPFQVAVGANKDVSTMSKEEELYYFEKNGAQVVKLPFKGEQSSMFVVLPPESENSKFASWMADEILHREFWMKVDQKGSMKQVRLQLPKFKFGYSRVLNEDLKSMGMRTLFDHADLSGLSRIASAVNFVKQDAFVQVDEEGAEAAAVTTIGIVKTSVEPMKKISMIVDRPFFVGIRDDLNGEFLFFGVITDPVWEE